MKNVKRQLILEKVGTVLVDRRFWVAVFTLVSILFGVPEFGEGADKLSAETVDLVVLVSQIAGVVLVPLGLTLSWAKRPPSGLGYKELVSELGSKLRDLGIE